MYFLLVLKVIIYILEVLSFLFLCIELDGEGVVDLFSGGDGELWGILFFFIFNLS